MSETRITVPATQTADAIPAAIRYLKSSEDRSRARASNCRAAATHITAAVVALAAIVQACNFPAACFVLLFFPWFACVVLYVLAKAAEKHANDLHAATIDGLADWIKEA